MPTYCGSAVIVEKMKTWDGSIDRIPVIGPEHFEVEADSERQAEELVSAAAKKSGLRPRRDRDHLLVIEVWLKPPPEQHWYAFRSTVNSPQVARSGIREYRPGQLYVFLDRAARDEWVKKGGGPYDVREAVKANALPRGWRPDHALDPETEEPFF